MHSHHSHSGEFCQHAVNTLEEMVLRAIELEFSLFCVSEHMPRYDERHLYPEELESSTSVDDLSSVFQKYISEARRLQLKYKNKIDILVGFEAEAIDARYAQKAKDLYLGNKLDYFVGSLHHTLDVPIDFDQEGFDKAVETAGGVESVYKHYFRELRQFVEATKPPVIGHIDLIRLYSKHLDFNLKTSSAWEDLVALVDAGIKANSLFEFNSSAVRKGFPYPYPQTDVAKLIIEKGGKFCLSDDSHSIQQVGLNYSVVLEYIKELGLKEVWRLSLESGSLSHKRIDVAEFETWVRKVNPPRT